MKTVTHTDNTISLMYMNINEAATLRAVCGHVLGNPHMSLRQYSDAIYSLLGEVKIEEFDDKVQVFSDTIKVDFTVNSLPDSHDVTWTNLVDGMSIGTNRDTNDLYVRTPDGIECFTDSAEYFGVLANASCYEVLKALKENDLLT